MIAPVFTQRAKQAQSRNNHVSCSGTVCQWRLVDHFNTVEEAERVLDKLRDNGVEAEVSLIDGLSVIARRPSLPENALPASPNF